MSWTLLWFFGVGGVEIIRKRVAGVKHACIDSLSELLRRIPSSVIWLSSEGRRSELSVVFYPHFLLLVLQATARPLHIFLGNLSWVAVVFSKLAPANGLLHGHNFLNFLLDLLIFNLVRSVVRHELLPVALLYLSLLLKGWLLLIYEEVCILIVNFRPLFLSQMVLNKHLLRQFPIWRSWADLTASLTTRRLEVLVSELAYLRKVALVVVGFLRLFLIVEVSYHSLSGLFLSEIL